MNFRNLRRGTACLVTVATLMLAGCGGGGGGSTGGGATDGGGAAANNQAGAPGGVVVNNPNPANPAAPAQDPTDVQLRAAMAQAGVAAAQAPPAQDPAKVALGRVLMFDKILSGNKDIACATCHTPSLATGDALSVSIGTGGVGSGTSRLLGAGRSFVPRNAPPLFNLSGVRTLFWDGRVHDNNGTLETPAGAALPTGLDSALAAQAMFPVLSRTEMRGNSGDTTVDSQTNELADIADADLQAQWDGIMNRLRAIPGYVTLFQAAYPTVAVNDLGFEHAANAIAAFEAEQFGTLDSPFDNYLRGDDTALTAQQKTGALIFYGRGRCATCHRGALLSDFQFHNIGTPQVGPGTPTDAPIDLGRFDETGQAQDRFRFRTPILRNVARTAPYMHSGPYATLAAAVGHYRNPGASLNNYNAGQLRGDLQSLVFIQGQINAGILNNIDPVVGAGIPLNNQDVLDLVAFLDSLTDPTALNRANNVPPTVPSGLPITD